MTVEAIQWIPDNYDFVFGDVNDTTKRLAVLYHDSCRDPLDRFNLNGTHVEVLEAKHDWTEENYLIKSGTENSDAGFFRLRKNHSARLVELSFYLRKEFRSSGLLTEAVPFIGNRVFRQLGFNKIEATAWETNGVAIKIYEKWLKQEGIRREAGYFEGNYVDLFQYGCLYSESDFKREKADMRKASLGQEGFHSADG